jgi:Ran GTPase-activating protein (RanGAP) involved in mRNA processing and transport
LCITTSMPGPGRTPADHPRKLIHLLSFIRPLIHSSLDAQELRLRDCGLGQAGARALGEAFAAGSLRRLTLLDVEGNAMGPKGMKALVQQGLWTAAATAAAAAAAAAATTSSLRHLYLGRNGLGDYGARHVALAVTHVLGGLQTLALPANGVTAAGAASLWAGVEEGGGMSRLGTLDVSHNPIGAEGARGLARCLRLGMWLALESLDVSGTQLGTEGVGQVAAALTTTPAPALRRLLLRDNGLGDTGLIRLASALGASACPAVEELVLGGGGGGGGGEAVGDVGASVLAEAIEAGGLEALRVLDLAGSCIGTDGLRALAFACRHRARLLETLDLSGGGGDNDGGGVQALGAYWLAAALGEGAFPRLKTLRLGGLGLERSGLYILHVAIRSGALRELMTLDLDDSPGLGDAGVGYLAIALRRGGCPNLRALGLANCGVGDRGAKHLAHALAARSSSSSSSSSAAAAASARLERLGLARNAALTGDGIAHLCEAARGGGLSGLMHLDLDGCRRLGDKGFRALAGAFGAGTLSALETLRAGGIGLMDEGLKAWVGAILEGPTRPALALRVLSLESNRLTWAGVAALSQLLLNDACRRLDLLALGDNGIDAAGTKALARALERCPLLRELNLGGQ